jgi:hypothetical protein
MTTFRSRDFMVSVVPGLLLDIACLKDETISAFK